MGQSTAFRPINSPLSLLNINTRGMVNRVTNFFCTISLYSPHVICVTQTWSHESTEDSRFVSPNYAFVRRDWTTETGGGVALFFKSYLDFTFFPLMPTAESWWCKLNLGKTVLVIDTFYPPPTAPVQLIRASLRTCFQISLAAENLR